MWRPARGRISCDFGEGWQLCAHDGHSLSEGWCDRQADQGRARRPRRHERSRRAAAPHHGRADGSGASDCHARARALCRERDTCRRGGHHQCGASSFVDEDYPHLHDRAGDGIRRSLVGNDDGGVPRPQRDSKRVARCSDCASGGAKRQRRLRREGFLQRSRRRAPVGDHLREAAGVVGSTGPSGPCTSRLSHGSAGSSSDRVRRELFGGNTYHAQALWIRLLCNYFCSADGSVQDHHVEERQRCVHSRPS
mmetsp:Transcript_54770/g.90763  ORF Transcript_54770/g.90763 Transcript_54770/m.90763 type:complete len:251 (-) Transcript_54770:2245-2997(-)